MPEEKLPDDGGEVTIADGEPLEIRLDQPCQICGETSVFNTTVTLRLPHFGNALQTTYHCTSCGFRHSDVIMLENRGPIRCELFVNSEALLNSRVLRSNSGTIRVPEIGAVIEPATSSESFVSNVEGVLDRIGGVINVVKSGSEPDVCERCETLLGKIERMREGREHFHIVIEDPYGNSAIMARDVSVTRLSENEASALVAGEITFDLLSESQDNRNGKGAGNGSRS